MWGVQVLTWLWVRKLGVAAGAILALTLSLCIYAFWIEPYWIEVTRHQITAPVDSPLKIAHLTDIHTSGIGKRESTMLKLINAEQPDIILISGDSISISSDYPGLREVLIQLKAPLGVWLVRGNHEDWWPIRNEREFYESAGARLLLNASAEVRAGVWLIGFDDVYGGSPHADKALSGVPETAFKIGLFHSPVFLETVAGRCDLAFAGHTHGGQVRLPFVRPLWLPAFSGTFTAGWFEREGTRMYVSRGIGTSLMDVRFLARPEIAIINVAASHPELD